MKRIIVFVAIILALSSCSVQRYNYIIIDHSNGLKQAANEVSRKEVLSVIDQAAILSDMEFEVKVSKTKSFMNDTTTVTKQH